MYIVKVNISPFKTFLGAKRQATSTDNFVRQSVITLLQDLQISLTYPCCQETFLRNRLSIDIKVAIQKIRWIPPEVDQ